jgi:hypothetical protein
MPARKGEVLIGYVGVDSGQIICCDPGYIDSEWVREEMREKCILTHPNGKKETIKRCSKRWFELIDDINSGKIKLEEKIDPKNNFSYNACAEKTLKEPHYGQLNFAMGHAGVGVVFSSGIGDGLYPVYARIEDLDELGPRIMEIRIDMWDHPLLKPEVGKNGKK